MTQTTLTLTGIAAIEYAELHGLPIRKYNDPIEDAREDLTPEEARAVAREDARLVYLPLTFTGWTKGDGTSTDGYSAHDYFAPDGSYLGSDNHGIEPIFESR